MFHAGSQILTLTRSNFCIPNEIQRAKAKCRYLAHAHSLTLIGCKHIIDSMRSEFISKHLHIEIQSDIQLERAGIQKQYSTLDSENEACTLWWALLVKGSLECPNAQSHANLCTWNLLCMSELNETKSESVEDTDFTWDRMNLLSIDSAMTEKTEWLKDQIELACLCDQRIRRLIQRSQFPIKILDFHDVYDLCWDLQCTYSLLPVFNATVACLLIVCLLTWEIRARAHCWMKIVKQNWEVLKVPLSCMDVKTRRSKWWCVQTARQGGLLLHLHLHVHLHLFVLLLLHLLLLLGV